MRTSFKLSLALVLISVAGAETRAQQNFDLVGSYSYAFAWGGTTITLKADGTFTAISGACTAQETKSGPYSVSNNVIRFTMLKYSLLNFDDQKVRDLTKRKERKKYLETDEPFKPESWELQIVRWGERVYLLDESVFDSFVDAINLGLEPRSVERYNTFYGRVYLREGDEAKGVTGPPPLSAEFLRNLLPQPVVATVIELKPGGIDAIATIDRGSADGLKPKMSLVLAAPPPFDYDTFSIESVTEHTATVKVFRYVKVGDQLTTRIPDVRFAE